MFGLIKNKLKSLFTKTEQVIEEPVKEEEKKIEKPKKEPKKEESKKIEKETSTKEVKKSSSKKKEEEKELPAPKELKELKAPKEVKELEAPVETKELPAPVEPKELPAPVEVKELPKPEEVKEITQEKKGFFSKIFGKKEIKYEQFMFAEPFYVSELIENVLDESLDKFSLEVYDGALCASSKPLSLAEIKLLAQKYTKDPDNKKVPYYFLVKDKHEVLGVVFSNDTFIYTLDQAKTKGAELKLDKKQLDFVWTDLNKSEEPVKEEKKEEGGFFSKTFKAITAKKLTEEDFTRIWEDLHLFLLEINIAFEIVQIIEQRLRQEIVGKALDRFGLTSALKKVMSEEVELILKKREANFDSIIDKALTKKKPVVFMILGVNGTGKTTSIAKVVHYFQKQKKSVVVAAADTFRAAAVEQLEEHCTKLQVKLVKHNQGSDPAAVAFDAIEHAKAKKCDIVLVDTAGRVPNNSNLLEELKKIKRVSQADFAIFIGDSVSGNDLIEQIELFNNAVPLDGIILTKVDTDEKPGSIVSTAYAIDKPIFFLGVGQTYDDLIVFNAKEIAKKLFDDDED